MLSVSPFQLEREGGCLDGEDLYLVCGVEGHVGINSKRERCLVSCPLTRSGE